MLDLRLIFVQVLDDLGTKMDPNMGPKIPQKSALGRPGPPRDANGRPEGSTEQFWSLSGPILEQFWGPFWPPIWNNFGTILKPRRLVTRLPYHSCYHEVPDTQGARVSVYNFIDMSDNAGILASKP